MRKESLLLGLLLVCACSLGVVTLVPRTAAAGGAPCEGTVCAVVVGTNINVYHNQARWNCCAGIRFDLVTHADTFDLYESENYDGGGPCVCLCYFDLLATIVDVAPGEYLVRVLAAAGGGLFGEVWVQVLGVTAWGDTAWSELPGVRACTAGLGSTAQSRCGGWNPDPVESTTWGHIKAVFR